MPDRLLERLRQGGAAGGPRVVDWSVYRTESRAARLGVKDRQAGNAHAPLNLRESHGARYLLVWQDGLVSRGHLERRQLEDPDRSLDDARAAAYADPDAAWVLGPQTLPRVALHDVDAAARARGDVETLAERLSFVRGWVESSGARTWSASFSAAESTSRLTTSRGLDVPGRATAVGWHVTLNGEIGDGHAARADEPAAEFQARLARLADVAARLDHPGRPPTAGVRPVVLHPRVVESYVLNALLFNLDGAVVERGEGRYEVGDFDRRREVVREDLTLRIDPLTPLRRGSYRHTTQGVPAARFTFIERGCLVSPCLDLKYARRLGRRPTPLPSGADVTFLVGAPRVGEAEAAAGADVLVLAVLGVHTQDHTSGDFSLSAPQTLAAGPAGFEGRLRATISGNLFELLRDPELRLVDFEGEHTPGLLARCRIDPA